MNKLLSEMRNGKFSEIFKSASDAQLLDAIKDLKKDKREVFESMIDDWRDNNSEEMSDLVIDEIVFDEARSSDINLMGEWTALVHDEKCTYQLSDNGTGNIIINYLGTK
jgi:hypothetical protein